MKDWFALGSSRFLQNGVSGFHHRRNFVSKSSASKKVMPAGWVVVSSIIAIAACAALGIAGSTSLRAHGGGVSTQAVAAAPKAPVLSAEQRGRVQASMGKLPLAFEANQGQTDPQVKYMARGNGYTVFLTATDTIFALNSSSQAAALRGTRLPGRARTIQPASTSSTKPLASNHRTAAVHLHLIG